MLRRHVLRPARRAEAREGQSGCSRETPAGPCAAARAGAVTRIAVGAVQRAEDAHDVGGPEEVTPGEWAARSQGRVPPHGPCRPAPQCDAAPSQAMATISARKRWAMKPGLSRMRVHRHAAAGQHAVRRLTVRAVGGHRGHERAAAIQREEGVHADGASRIELLGVRAGGNIIAQRRDDQHARFGRSLPPPAPVAVLPAAAPSAACR